MARAWYFVDGDGEKVGPYKASAIREFTADGTIDFDTLIWRDDMDEWVKAGQIRKLFPPFLSEAVSPNPPTRTSSKTGRTEGDGETKKTLF